MQDIVKRLRKYADEYAPVPVEDLRAAADEIERLRDVPRFRVFIGGRSGWAVADQNQPAFAKVKWDDAEEVQTVAWVKLDNRKHARPFANVGNEPRPPTSFDEFEQRLAMLESSVRRTGYRIDAAAAAMKDVASRESVHHSVRYVADNLRIAFVGRPADVEEVDGHG